MATMPMMTTTMREWMSAKPLALCLAPTSSKGDGRPTQRSVLAQKQGIPSDVDAGLGERTSGVCLVCEQRNQHGAGGRIKRVRGAPATLGGPVDAWTDGRGRAEPHQKRERQQLRRDVGRGDPESRHGWREATQAERFLTQIVLGAHYVIRTTTCRSDSTFSAGLLTRDSRGHRRGRHTRHASLGEP